MNNTTRYEILQHVALIVLDSPPVNGLSLPLRSGIVADVRRAEADDAIKAIVLVGAGKAFSGGADIREFGTPAALAQPSLRSVIEFLESCTKPVIAAIGGTCMGGGLELALGCHFRVAPGGFHRAAGGQAGNIARCRWHATPAAAARR